VINDKEEASKIAMEGIHEILSHLDRWGDVVLIYPREPSIEKSLVRLYEHVLDFLMSAVKHLSQRSSSKTLAFAKFNLDHDIPHCGVHSNVLYREAVAVDL
jgi:hypothetical protein